MCHATITIIIVNFNSGEMLRDCLKSISMSSKDGLHICEIVIVDNNSYDGSFKNLDHIDLPIKTILNSENIGFAAACNQGAALAQGEFYLFLNPDTCLYEDSLSMPIKFMLEEESANIGICGIRLVDEFDQFSTSAARFPTLAIIAGKTLGLSRTFPKIFPPHLMNSSELNACCLVDQIIGAYFLIRKSVYISCCGFDEIFYVYYEEVDLSLRAKQNGFGSYYFSKAKAFHKGGGCSDKVKSARLFYELKSRIFYAKKHFSKIDFVLLVLLTMIEFPIRLSRSLVKLSFEDTVNTTSAYVRLLNFFIRRSYGCH